MEHNIEEIKRKLKKYGQEHLLNFYNTLDERKKEELLEQIERIDFDLINSLYRKTKNVTVEDDATVEPIEFIDNTLVIYSLGNFISGQRGIEKLTGLMVSVDVIKKNNSIILDNVSSELTYTYSDNQKGYRGNFKVYPYSKLTESLLPNYKMYYNKYMDIAIHGDSRIGKSDYSGNSK